jgi:ABC-type Fe3+/spermidine/putrescine transport system ATPase subunit
VRPERIRITTPDTLPESGIAVIDGVIRSTTYLGSTVRVVVAVEGGEITVVEQNLQGGDGSASRAAGTEVRLLVERRHVQALAESA